MHNLTARNTFRRFSASKAAWAPWRTNLESSVLVHDLTHPDLGLFQLGLVATGARQAQDEEQGHEREPEHVGDERGNHDELAGHL